MKANIKVEIIQESVDPLYEQRESGVFHTAFQLEYILYNAIRNGDVVEMEKAVNDYLHNGVTMGKMSSNSIRQVKYWSVACISIAIHYSILGGLDETQAYNLSDKYIRHVDHISDMEECVSYLKDCAVELTEQVRTSAVDKDLSPTIRKCLHYINTHLHDRLEIQEIADILSLSRDYLSVLFKKEMNISLHKYIIKEKLKAATIMLMKNIDYDKICYDLGFCSETHFITCFKKEYGITPGEYKNLNYLT